ncbi:Rieske 2Fe-2S domain-containing protein [Streptomyces sp. NPDC047079]|uniref:Rieske 2Fe-2S domain-containing protein n=1 Tax=Streptomyces sp. NPDC047079 TaxID=3154607 RepID=UPI0033E24D4E
MGGAATGQWQEAMRLDDLWEGDMQGVEVAGTKVLLVNVDGEVRAYHNRCPHQAWALDEGDFDGQTITCSRHLWEFDADTGQGVNPGTCRLTAYPCRVTETGTIMVDVG